MMDDTEEAIRRADRALALLDDEMIKASFAEIGEEITRQWRDSPVRDTEGRERLHLMLRLLDRLRQVFEAHIETGKVARKRLADVERERSIKNLFGVI